MDDSKFSENLKELIVLTRELALDFGYDHISTIHFFLADCQLNRSWSIFNFAFNDISEFEVVKKQYQIKNDNLLNFSSNSLPLTIECENVFRKSILKSKYYQQTNIQPWHFFIAALESKESLLAQSFLNENAAIELETYYRQKDLLKPDLTKKQEIKRFLLNIFRRK